jgi:hypothetical protein
MELIKQHISSYLYSFVNEKSITFDDNFNEIQNDLRTDFIGLIQYLDNLLNETFSSSNESIDALHIHIEDELNDSQKLLIAEFLCIKTFRNYNSNDSNINQTNLSLNELIAGLETKQNRLETRCPDGASGKNGGNRIWKNWVKDKKENRSLLEFYKNLNINSAIIPKSIFNTQKNFSNSVSQIFEFKPYCVLPNSKNKSYNLLNATNTLNEIDTINNDIIDELDSIVLFDCERKSLMSNFSFEEINKWNSDYDTSFKKYLIITFSKEFQSINNVRNKIELIRERFKIPPNSSFTINKSEIDFLLKRKVQSSTSIVFDGFESSSFWDTFVLETSIRELYELRSIKLMNIYSICYTDEIKDYIIEDLFSKKEVSELISSSTKMAIIELRDDDIETLKEALSNTLDFIINSDIKTEVIYSLTNTPTIIFDEAIIRNIKLLSKIKDCIGLTKSIKLKTWSDLLNSGSEYLLILSYRDQGKFPNYYYPNLLEIKYHPETIAKAILPRFLFGYHYKWSKYYLLKEYYKYLNHPIRENYFEWNQLRKLILELKPEAKLDIDWDLENVYSSSENKESYKVKFKNQRVKSFHSSDLLIFSEIDIEKPKIERMKWFFENVDFDETKYKIQKIDELLDEFNPAEKLIDTTQQEIELQLIRKQLGLGNESAGRIWKILLINKSELLGFDSLYEELKLIFEKNKITLVSINHFRNSWIKIDSDSLMPRGNKVFKTLCDYLELSNNYRLILYRLKNASISGKIEATRKYSSLLKDLFADGCFDKGVSLESILQNKSQNYQKNHSLEELGIDNQNPMSGLITLTELIQPELKLVELETIEKLSNE